MIFQTSLAAAHRCLAFQLFRPKHSKSALGFEQSLHSYAGQYTLMAVKKTKYVINIACQRGFFSVSSSWCRPHWWRFAATLSLWKTNSLDVWQCPRLGFPFTVTRHPSGASVDTPVVCHTQTQTQTQGCLSHSEAGMMIPCVRVSWFRELLLPQGSWPYIL